MTLNVPGAGRKKHVTKYRRTCDWRNCEEERNVLRKMILKIKQFYTSQYLLINEAVLDHIMLNICHELICNVYFDISGGGCYGLE